MIKNIRKVLEKRILVLDGATGTQIQSFDLTDDDFGGEHFHGCNELLNEIRPDVVEEIHKRYLKAGADIIETNSFGGTPLILAEYGIAEKAYDLAKKSAEIARKAADEFSTPDKPRFVAGSIGPTTKMINVTGGITLDELKEEYKVHIRGLIDGGCDIILFETFADTSNLKAGVLGLKEICKETGKDIPHMISVTIEQNGTMLAGQAIDALYVSVEHFEPLSIGINCGLGPKQVVEHIRTLSQFSGCFSSLHPNAGLPDENGEYTESPEIFSQTIKKIAESGYVNIIGGCCGTTPDHIRKVAETVKDIAPRIPKRKAGSFVSGIELLEFTDDNRPVSVGERTNMTGSKKFKKLIRKEKFDDATEIAKAQVMKGAQVIDINLDDTDSDVLFNVKNFYPLAVRKIKTPIMIDSSLAPEVFEESLKQLQGKAIINSVNFENMERFDKISGLAKKYGASVIALLIDKDEMAVSVERKVAVAKAMFTRLTETHGIDPQDIIFDCLVFPVASGDDTYFLSAKNTIESIKEIKSIYPMTKFSLGVSNCSFGLPPAGREAVNSAYLYYAVKNGLDMAIVNSEKLVRYGSLSDEEKELCKEMVFNNTDTVIKRFIEFYSDKKTKAKDEAGHLT
ncbi:MAG: dihydropteroate synthase, partial [bacterium]|nr:dihydropteroate synthase [bacterium]